MWAQGGNLGGGGINSLANSDSDYDSTNYGYGDSGVGFGSGSGPLRASSFLPPSLLMALNQQSNEVLSSINFERVINSYMKNSAGDVESLDCSVALSHHIIDCIYALKSVLNVQRNSATSNSEINELDTKAPSALYNGCVSELGGLVLTTVSNPWTNDQSSLLKNYYSISEQIMHRFPEMFNKSSKATGSSLMHISCRYVAPIAGESVTKMILSNSPKLVSHLNNRNQFPLHLAMRNKNITLSVVKSLVKAHEEAISAPDDNGLLPIHYAVMTENLQTISYDIVDFLIKKDPQTLTLRCKYGRLPLHLAMNSVCPNISVIKLLLASYPEGCHVACDNGWLPIHRLVSQSNISLETLRYLNQPNFNASFNVTTTKGGQLPLHIYVDQADSNELGLLILIQASPQSVLETDSYRYTALNMVLDNKNPSIEIAKLLLYGNNAQELAQIGVPFNIKNEAILNPSITSETLFLFPLHFVVGMNEIVNYELCSLIAALNPNAINRSGDAQNMAWSPYLKAKERKLNDLVILFDMILSDDSYRLGIIQKFNENYSIHYNELLAQLEELTIQALKQDKVPSISLPKEKVREKQSLASKQKDADSEEISNSKVSPLNQAIRLPRLNSVNAGPVGRGPLSLAPLPSITQSNGVAKLMNAGSPLGADASIITSTLNDNNNNNNKKGGGLPVDGDDLSLTSFNTIKTTKTSKIKVTPTSNIIGAGNTSGNLSDVINDALATQNKKSYLSGGITEGYRPALDVDLNKYLRPQKDTFDDQITDLVIEKYNKKPTDSRGGGAKPVNITIAADGEGSISSTGEGARRRYQRSSARTAQVGASAHPKANSEDMV